MHRGPCQTKNAMASLCLLLAAAVPVASCGASEEQYALAKRAVDATPKCEAIADKFFQRAEKLLVWDRYGDSLHAAHSELAGSLQYEAGNGPVTAFIVGGTDYVQVGTYSISGQPAYRQRVYVCAVNFMDASGPGQAVAQHEVMGRDPRESRSVGQGPEYGDLVLPIAAWIRSLRTGMFAEAALWSPSGSLDVAAATATLKSADVFVGLAGARALKETADHRAVDALLQALQDPVETVRLEAIKSLIAIRDPRALEPLTRMTANGAYPSAQFAAKRALEQLRSLVP